MTQVFEMPGSDNVSVVEEGPHPQLDVLEAKEMLPERWTLSLQRGSLADSDDCGLMICGALLKLSSLD